MENLTWADKYRLVEWDIFEEVVEERERQALALHFLSEGMRQADLDKALKEARELENRTCMHEIEGEISRLRLDDERLMGDGAWSVLYEADGSIEIHVNDEFLVLTPKEQSLFLLWIRYKKFLSSAFWEDFPEEIDRWQCDCNDEIIRVAY